MPLKMNLPQQVVREAIYWHWHQAPFVVLAAGGVHVPLMIEGSLSFGQYIRSIKLNLLVGAGSQFDSLSAPGD